MGENCILSMFASKESASLFVSLKNFLQRQSPLYFMGSILLWWLMAPPYRLSWCDLCFLPHFTDIQKTIKCVKGKFSQNFLQVARKWTRGLCSATALGRSLEFDFPLPCPQPAGDAPGRGSSVSGQREAAAPGSLRQGRCPQVWAVLGSASIPGALPSPSAARPRQTAQNSSQITRFTTIFFILFLMLIYFKSLQNECKNNAMLFLFFSFSFFLPSSCSKF